MVNEGESIRKVGTMEIPESFRYREAFLKGRPKHEKYDSFWIKHPPMTASRRAKIFTPFDALRGFDFAILMKNELYEDQRILSPEDQEELNRRFNILHNLTYNSRMAKENRVQVDVTYYEPCSDANSEAYGSQGQYKTITGICWNVDAEVTRTILVDDIRIRIEDIRSIESTEDLFERHWEDQSVDWGA